MKESVERYLIGRFLCGLVREFLEAERFAGRKIDFHESRGWLAREFVVKGDPADIAHIDRIMCAWIEKDGRRGKLTP